MLNPGAVGATAYAVPSTAGGASNEGVRTRGSCDRCPGSNTRPIEHRIWRCRGGKKEPTCRSGSRAKKTWYGDLHPVLALVSTRKSSLRSWQTVDVGAEIGVFLRDQRSGGKPRNLVTSRMAALHRAPDCALSTTALRCGLPGSAYFRRISVRSQQSV